MTTSLPRHNQAHVLSNSDTHVFVTRFTYTSQNASRRRPCCCKERPVYATGAQRLTHQQLIAQCTSHFKIGNDKTSLHRINESLSTLSEFRTQHLRSIQSSLSALNRTHQTLSANHNHTLSQHNPTNHAAEILRLDTEKFKIAKQASDLEIEGERLQSDLARLGNVASELEEEGVEGGVEPKAGEDATV